MQKLKMKSFLFELENKKQVQVYVIKKRSIVLFICRLLCLKFEKYCVTFVKKGEKKRKAKIVIKK